MLLWETLFLFICVPHSHVHSGHLSLSKSFRKSVWVYAGRPIGTDMCFHVLLGKECTKQIKPFNIFPRSQVVVNREHSSRISYSLVTKTHITPYIYTYKIHLPRLYTPHTHTCKYTPQINHVHIYKSHKYTQHRNIMDITHSTHKIDAYTDIQYVNTCRQRFSLGPLTPKQMTWGLIISCKHSANSLGLLLT